MKLFQPFSQTSSIGTFRLYDLLALWISKLHDYPYSPYSPLILNPLAYFLSDFVKKKFFFFQRHSEMWIWDFFSAMGKMWIWDYPSSLSLIANTFAVTLQFAYTPEQTNRPKLQCILSLWLFFGIGTMKEELRLFSNDTARYKMFHIYLSLGTLSLKPFAIGALSLSQLFVSH